MKTLHPTSLLGRTSPVAAGRTVPLSTRGVGAVWLTGLGCWALIAMPHLVHANPTATSARGAVQVKVSARMAAPTASGPVLRVVTGHSVRIDVADNARYRVANGVDNIGTSLTKSGLEVTGRQAGDATLIVDAPDAAAQVYLLRVVDASAATATPSSAAAPRLAQTAPAATAPASTTNNDLAPAAPTASTSVPASTTNSDLAPPAPTATTEAPASTTNNDLAPAKPVTVTPATATEAPAAAVPTTTLVTGAPVGGPTPPDSMQLSPTIAVPGHLPLSREPYPTTRGKLPGGVTTRRTAANRNVIDVTQGHARLLSFKDNILSVFFSDINVMDARAVNARTIAITGLSSGTSTLAVFSERFPGDAVGRANIYNISVRAQGSSVRPVSVDPETLASAVRVALDDERINVSTVQAPDGSIAVRLTGSLRDQVEVDAARNTAALFTPNIISSLIVDKSAPAYGEAAALTGEQQLQNRLRSITGNSTLELTALPNGLALKGVVSSEDEARSVLRLVPLATNQKVVPFLIVRTTSPSGAVDNDMYNGPVLTAEDQDMTQRLRQVTGVETVDVVRTAQNGLAVYGTVRNRREWDAVRRYTIILPQRDMGAGSVGGVSNAAGISGNSNTPAPVGGPLARGAGVTSYLEDPARPAYSPTSSYQLSNGVQWFVRVLDGSDSAARVVTADTKVVEISRSAEKALGMEFGTVQLLTDTFDPNTGVRNRTVGTDFQGGTFTGGNGFVGLGPKGLVDPVRLRLNALYTSGNIRMLANPSLMALEGTSGQITIGGSRPIPQATIVGGNTGGTVQNIVFRKYGIILTMRPTITDDDTIILQIRADVTSIDPTTEINLNGAFIPGEIVRSVDTTLTVKEGDIIVMGGLMSNERHFTTNKFPILSEIPLLGKLFQSKRFTDNQSELAIVLQPKIRRVPTSDLSTIVHAPGFPELPGIQAQNNIFGGSTGGTNGP